MKTGISEQKFKEAAAKIGCNVRQFKFVIGAVIVILLGIFAKLFNLK